MMQKNNFQLGVRLLNSNKLLKAQKLFESMFEQNPQNFDAGFNLALAYRKLGKLKLALELHQRLHRICPKDLENIVALGNLYAENNQRSKALAFYRRAMRVNPNDERIQYNIGITQEELNEQRKALKSYGKALRLKPTYLEAGLRKVRLLEELKRGTLALRVFNTLLGESFSPQLKAELLYEKGCLLARLGKYKEALECLKSLKRKFLKSEVRKALSGNIRDLEQRT